jgi:hypothetical protein
VSNRDILYLDSAILAEFPELVRVEIRSQICDDSVGEAKAVHDVINEADYSIREDLCNRLVLDPLCKLVDGHQHMGKTS